MTEETSCRDDAVSRANDAAQAMANFADMVSAAVRRAWNLGQIYWQQADSEYVSQNKKADETVATYGALIEETSRGVAAATAAMLTLQQAGYTYAGGQLWRPPLGKPPVWTIHETDASRDVLAERARHLTHEGWTPVHDDEHANGDIGEAAICYIQGNTEWGSGNPHQRWPWALCWWKPTDRRRNLVKAGALILAEIERIDRAAAIAQRAVTYLTENPPCAGATRPLPPIDDKGGAQ